MEFNEQNLLDFARIAISKSVYLLKKSNAVDGRVLFEAGRDIKLAADFFLNKELANLLSAATGIRCMSEEEEISHAIAENDTLWIIDPLDGSMNFSRGVPLYCISVALWRDQRPVIGVIHDIARQQTYFCCHGIAAVDNLPIRVGKIKSPSKAILATGFPVLNDFSESAMIWYTGFIKGFKKIRMLGTAALSLAWVAEGKLDAYYERDIMIWL